MFFVRATRRLGEKLDQILEMVATCAVAVAKSKIAKISTSKINLKVPNIYIKPPFKPKNTCNKPVFKTDHLGENVKNC
jgi:hypothetical protein